MFNQKGDTDQYISITTDYETLNHIGDRFGHELALALKEAFVKNEANINISVGFDDDVHNAFVNIADALFDIARALEKRNANEHHQS